MKKKWIDIMIDISKGTQPQHIRYDGRDYYWSFEIDDYDDNGNIVIRDSRKLGIIRYMTRWEDKLNDYVWVDDEIEIIEEPKKIKKIKFTNLNDFIDESGFVITTTDTDIYVARKLNEIIDYINKGDNNE